MIYEFRTYTLTVGSMGKFEESFANALPHREKYSKLTACWHTDIGPLNQIIHVWGYDDMKHRAEVRAAAAADPNWPPAGDDAYIVKMETEIVIPGALPEADRARSLWPRLRDALLRRPTQLHARDHGNLGRQTPRKAEVLATCSSAGTRIWGR